MTSLKTANRRIGSLFAVAALVLATVTPGLVPAFASAAQVTERSIELSSASKAATGVTYTVNFTPVSDAAAVVFDFCSNSPLTGQDCTAPGGFSVATATVSGTTPADAAKGTGDANTASSVIVTGDFNASEAADITLTGVTNPTLAGPLYVRIVTFASAGAAGDYESATPGAYIDDGGAAVSITDTVAVSAAVLESMTFCVSGAAITTENCNTVTAPVLKLGEGAEDILALSAQAVSEGSIYSQISTNAASGAVVNLKTTTTCGGLKRAQATGCDIVAAGADGITAGQAKFGVKVATADNPGTGENSNGAYQIFGATRGEIPAPYYSSSVFKLNYVQAASTGITSPYGDPLLDTADAPVNNKNVEIIFGASAANNTPAGMYSTDLSLIATGKF